MVCRGDKRSAGGVLFIENPVAHRRARLGTTASADQSDLLLLPPPAFSFRLQIIRAD